MGLDWLIILIIATLVVVPSVAYRRGFQAGFRAGYRGAGVSFETRTRQKGQGVN